VPGVKTNEREGTRAVLRGAGFPANKARVVLDLIRGLDVARARDVLTFSDRGAAEIIGKLLDSAVANAANNDNLDPEELFISACFADEGRTLKRGRPRARGRYARIRKRSCHITIIVSRLPEDRLTRLKAKHAAENANRRARRVAGGRKAAGETRARRTGKAEEAGIVDTDEAAVEQAEAVTEETAAVAAEETTEAVTDETVTDATADTETTDAAADDVIAAADQDSSAESGESSEEPVEGDREEEK
jgi:large subunit ribosomal protein L22